MQKILTLKIKRQQRRDIEKYKENEQWMDNYDRVYY